MTELTLSTQKYNIKNTLMYQLNVEKKTNKRTETIDMQTYVFC